MVRFGGVSTAVVLMGMGIAPPSFAQQSVMSAAGYTGLSVTPTAHLMPWGHLSLAYDSQIVGGPTVGQTYSNYGTSGHNFVAGFGLSPFLEISGRIASNKIQENCYTDGCGIRDLSFNLKGGVALDTEGKFKIAAGANDFGGNANFFRTIYGVATYSPDNFDFSAGYARKSKGLIGSATPLDGVFGSVAYRPSTWLQTHIEYNDGSAWVGSKVFAPAEWLPSGWAANIGANFRVRGDEKGSRTWISLGLSIPLYKVPDVKNSQSKEDKPIAQESSSGFESPPYWRTFPSVGVREFSVSGLSESDTSVLGRTAIVQKIPTAPPAPIKVEILDDELARLADYFREKGFEDIYVGRLPNGVVAIQINNATYNVNAADGLGVALGVVARHLEKYKVGYRLVMTQRQVAIVGVAGSTDCLADWIAKKPLQCVAGTLHTPGTDNVSALLEGVQWYVEGGTPSWKTMRLIVKPALRTSIATEYGLLDYSAGIQATLQQPLWKGAYLEWSHVSSVIDSADYKSNGVYGANRIISGVEKALLHQVIRIPLEYLFGAENSATAAQWGATALTAHVAAGRIDSNYRGAYGELRWEPFEGRHRFGLEGGRFERTTLNDYSRPSNSRVGLASYRYSFAATKTDFSVTAGQYLQNDRGGQFLITQWFDDVAVNLYVRRTKFDFEKDSRNFAGIELVLPLTPRKDMNPSYHIQISGASRWSYGIETKVGGTNFISTGQGLVPDAAVLDSTFNADRASMNYFEDNMPRIRSAAAK